MEMEMKVILKPCEDCGGEAEIIEDEKGYHIRCKKCHKIDDFSRRGHGYVNKDYAISVWNDFRHYELTEIDIANLKDPGFPELVRLWCDLRELQDTIGTPQFTEKYSGDDLDELEDRLVEAQTFLNYHIYGDQKFEESRMRDTWKDDINKLIDYEDMLAWCLLNYATMHRNEITITQGGH